MNQITILFLGEKKDWKMIKGSRQYFENRREIFTDYFFEAENVEICLDFKYKKYQELKEIISRSNREERTKYLAVSGKDEELKELKQQNIASLGIYDTDYLLEPAYQWQNLEDAEPKDFFRVWQRFHNIPWMITETKRCILRESIPKDFEALYPLIKNENKNADRKKEKEKFDCYIRQMYPIYETGLYTVIEKETGAVAGRVGLTPFKWEEKEVLELGYELLPHFRRKKIATEVCMALLSDARKRFPDKTVLCRIRADRQASLKLAKTLGFHHISGEIYIDRFGG